MIVDDDLSASEVLGTLLRSDGYNVIECANGREALGRLRQPPAPDVIVLDLLMPVMDGWQFRVEQKRDTALARIPVVALSADSTPQAAAIDAAAYLSKPVDYGSVATAIERLVLEIERRELQAHLAEVSRLSSLGTLAAGMAHEINNPLAYLLLNLTWLRQELPRILADRAPGRPMEQQRVDESLESIRIGAERIREVVQSLRTFSRPDLEIRGPVHLGEVVRASIEMAAHEIRSRAHLIERIDDAVPPVVGNPARLGQVFLNLLLNAVQALPENDSKHEITAVVRTEGGRVIAEVHDSGSGIDPAIRERIFEPFFTTKPVGAGTGLGLAISHGIVTAHGGNISVESEPGKGSRFRVELPAAPSDGQAAEARRVAPRVGPARVLIVDDEPAIGVSLTRLLTSRKHVVEVLTDAKEAVERILAGARYDLILCDLVMPGMDGPSFFREVLESVPLQAARITFMTGGTFTERARKFLAEVPNRHLTKPFDLQEILDLIVEAPRRIP